MVKIEKKRSPLAFISAIIKVMIRIKSEVWRDIIKVQYENTRKYT